MKRKSTGQEALRFFDKLMRIAESRNFERAITILAVGFTVLTISGLVYGAVAQPPGVFFTQTAVRVFIPSIRVQSYSEIFVVATLYLLFFAGSLMYLWGIQQRGARRSATYMLFFSSILILVSVLGLIGGYLSKLG